MNTTREVMFLLLFVLTSTFSVGQSHETNAQVPTNQTQTTSTMNFSQEISEKVSNDPLSVSMIYESPSTVILEGGSKRFTGPDFTGDLVFNDLLWKAVDLMKQKGFVIDTIDLSQTGEASFTYQIYMSQKVT
jgi:hypothetical protein